MENAGRRARSGRSVFALSALIAVTLTVALQCLRVFFPIVYTYRESSGLTAAALVGIAVFAAPVIAPVLVRVAGSGRAVVAVALTLAALRLTIQAAGSFGVVLAAVATGTGLVALAVVVLVARRSAMALAFGVVAGVALDTLIRSGSSTWDLAWQSGAAAWFVAAALATVLAGAAWSVHRDRPVDSSGGALLAGLGLGPFLALQVLLFQNPGFVTSSGHVALATGAVVVLAGDALALGASWLVVSGRASRGAGAGAAVVLALVAWVATGTTGSGAIVTVLLGQAAATLLVTRALLATGPRPVHPVVGEVAGFGGGALALGLLVVGYQLHYDRPLPVTNRWLPVVAAVVLGIVAMTAHPIAADAPAGRGVARRALTIATGLAILAASAFVALATSEPDLSPARVDPRALTIMTYNVHEAVARDGHLDPEAMARTVRRLRPDVLVVEEVGRGWPLSGGLDLAEWAKRSLGMPYLWAPAADHQFGNVLLSRVPVRSTRVLALPKGTGPTNRSAIVARVGPVDGRTVTIVGTHLQNGEGHDRAQTRIAEMRTILRAVGGVRHVVIAGDLNSDPASPELATLLHAGFRTSQPTDRCTLKTSNANCVDWILASPDLVESNVRALAVDTFDHRPLVTTVRPAGWLKDCTTHDRGPGGVERVVRPPRSA